MTEEEWISAARPSKLLRFLHSDADASDRKFRLFGVACCRRVVEQLPDVTLADVIDGCEQLADDFTFARLTSLRRTADRVAESARSVDSDSDQDYIEYSTAVCQLTEYPIAPEHCADSCMNALCGHDDYDTGRGEMLFQVDLLRDVFGNPFRPVVFSSEWRTDTAVSLARTMYESREFGAMPILADALQDAGCDNPDILDHCRDTAQVHVRGCWVVDLVLGKG